MASAPIKVRLSRAQLREYLRQAELFGSQLRYPGILGHTITPTEIIFYFTGRRDPLRFPLPDQG